MNRIVNVVLQIIFVLVFAGIVFVTQGADVDGALSNGQIGIFILCIPLCWVVMRFFHSVWFYFSILALLLGFVGGHLCVKLNGDLSVDSLGQSLSGYTIALFTVFLFCGIAMACVRKTYGLFFLRRLRMPLAAWVIIALLLDFIFELLFFEQNFGVILLEVKAIALLSGLIIGVAAKVTAITAKKVASVDLETLCFVGASVADVDDGEYFEDTPGVTPARSPAAPRSSVPRPGAPGGSPGGAPRPAQPGFAMRSPAAPKVAKAQAKMSVLDAKLEALCSGGGGGEEAKAEETPASSTPVRERPMPGTPPGGAPPAAEKAEEEVPKSTATHKIVSSVDFG